MPSLDVVVASDVAQTPRVKQISGMFDVPPREKLEHRWTAELPLDEKPWNVGLIVGPSGAGKSQCARALFGADVVNRADALRWTDRAVVDDFRADLSITQIAEVCGAVGFNTIPSWMKPFGVLSNGERFRVMLARLLIESEGLVVLDEFTSIVDRQVAKIGAHAVQKFVRRNDRQFVAVTCHQDVLEWLQPDWVFQPSTCEFGWRSVQQRPTITGCIRRCSHREWPRFAPYHYMSATLNPAARCFGVYVDGCCVAFVAVLARPISRGRGRATQGLFGLSRLVVLPDWQGMKVGVRLSDTVAAAYRCLGRRMRSYPAHPALIRFRAKDPHWRMVKRAGWGKRRSRSRHIDGAAGFGGRPNAVFEYVGPAHEDPEAARQLIESKLH